MITQRLPAFSGLPPRGVVAGYVLLCLAPLVLALAQGPAPRSVYRELSAALAMIGLMMVLLQFVLSGRMRWVSGRIGIDSTMRVHQIAMWGFLTAILLHPLLYVMPRLFVDPTAAWTSLTRMFMSAGLRSGAVAWVLTLLVVLLTVFKDRLPIRYEIWRFSHAIFAIAIAGLGVQHALRVGRYSGDPWLAAFWIASTLGVIAIALDLHLLAPLRRLRRPYRVVTNRVLADRTHEVVIEPERGAPLAFVPGQFVWLNLGHSPFSLTEHPLSIASAPAPSSRLSFVIKESGDFTRTVGTIPVGTRAYVDGPHGNFSLAHRRADGIMFLAGGVGLAPIMSILRALHTARDPRPLRLLYGNRVATQIAYRDELDAMTGTLDLTIGYLLSEPPPNWRGVVGEFSPAVIDAFLADGGGRDWLYFVSGPPPMIRSAQRALRARGVPSARMVTERFRYD